MQVIVKVIHVEEMMIKNKQVAGVVMMAGSEPVNAILWNNEYVKGTHKQAERMKGELVVTDLNVELFNDRLRYGFGYSPTFIPLANYARQHAPQARSQKPEGKAA